MKTKYMVVLLVPFLFGGLIIARQNQFDIGNCLSQYLGRDTDTTVTDKRLTELYALSYKGDKECPPMIFIQDYCGACYSVMRSWYFIVPANGGNSIYFLEEQFGNSVSPVLSINQPFHSILKILDSATQFKSMKVKDVY